MTTLKKVLCLGASSMVVMLALGASSASAADTATCSFTGLAGNLNPPIPAALNDPGGPTTTEIGTYNFAGDATCVAVEGDTGDNPATSGVYAVHIVSSGNYANKVCGTGTATATDPNATIATG